MKVFVGLGNPGEKFKSNRHNVGFMFLDHIVSSIKYSVLSIKPFKKDTLLKSEITHIQIGEESITLVKPQTYMNKSGTAVRKLVSRFTFHVSRDIYVIHDDLDIKLGSFKIQKGKGPHIHNGINSIESELKTSEFWRIRIGVDARVEDQKIPGSAYVLQDFKAGERELLYRVFQDIIEELHIN